MYTIARSQSFLRTRVYIAFVSYCWWHVKYNENNYLEKKKLRKIRLMPIFFKDEEGM